MNLGNVKRRVDQFGTDLKQLLQQVSGKVPLGTLWRGRPHSIARGTSSAMPYTLPAPIIMSNDLGKQSDFCRMARGGTSMSGLVAIMDRQPWISVDPLGALTKRKAGELFEGQPWLVAKLTKEQVAEICRWEKPS